MARRLSGILCSASDSDDNLPISPLSSRDVGSICGICGFLLEARKEISFPSLIKKRWSELRPDSRYSS